jgi:hypothetical protein
MDLRRLTVVLLLSTVVACAGRTAPRAIAPATDPVNVDELWKEPTDLASRDLFHGSGGPELAPDPNAAFTFVSADRSGYSPGFDVKGPDGREWSVKTGKESQTEIVSSRVLWAIGGPTSGPQEGGRFRPTLPDRKVVRDWSWYENEFVGTQPFKGLVVVNVMLNNWDWKTSNNKVYEITGTSNGEPRRMFVVRDLGASLGKTDYPKVLSWLPMRGFGQGSRNELEDFEEQGFIKRVENGRVEFFYRGIHAEILDTLTVQDVVWTSRLLSQLSDQQWDDAFRAAGYDETTRKRFIAKMKAKIAEGLALAT